MMDGQVWTASLNDGLVSMTAGLGTERDKAATLSYERPEIDDRQLINAYRGSWLPRKIVDVPALDSCRRWRAWNAEADQITALEAEETRLNVRGKVLEARTKARLFGGCALYIATGEEDVSAPLHPERIKKGGIQHLTVISQRTLTAGVLDMDPLSPSYGEPSSFNVSSGAQGLVRIHPSRLVLFNGAEKPDTFLTGGRSGWSWGDSVLMATLDAIKQAEGTAANIASLIFEAKIDVIRIPNLMSKIGDARYERDLLKRFALAATGKGNNGSLILDKEEEYEQKNASFASLPDVLDRFLQIVSGAADIPATRLLGQSPAGMSATGESDIRNYYDRIQSAQELEMRPAMSVLDECLIRSALGDRPEDVHYEWRSLWQTSETERAEIAAKIASTIKTLADTALFPDEPLMEAAVNMLVENGVAPGFEQQIKEHFKTGGRAGSGVYRSVEELEESGVI